MRCSAATASGRVEPVSTASAMMLALFVLRAEIAPTAEPPSSAQSFSLSSAPLPVPSSTSRLTPMPRRRQQLDGALALALELRRLGRLGDGATRALIELLASAPERHVLTGEQKARCFQVGAERGEDDLEAIGHRCGLQAVCSQVMRVPRRPSRVDRGCSHPRFCRCRSRKTPDLMPSGKATSGLS